MPKTVYLYNISKNFRFERAYLCLITKQNSPAYIGELTIEDDCNFVSFSHIIQQKDRKLFSNEVSICNKEQFLRENQEKSLIQNNEYYGKTYKKDIIVEIKTISHENNFDEAIITYLQPSEYCCIGAQDFFYSYVENLSIKDITISEEELIQKLNVVPDSIELHVMKIEVCTNPYLLSRGHFSSHKIQEYYFPYYNTSISSYNDLNINFNPLSRYNRRKSPGEIYIVEEPKVIRKETITDKVKILKVYNLIKSYLGHNVAVSNFYEEETIF